MELQQEVVDAEPGPSRLDSTTPTNNAFPDEALGEHAVPVAENHTERTMEHDSLVTVRLSEPEPPSLAVNTAAPHNVNPTEPLHELEDTLADVAEPADDKEKDSLVVNTVEPADVKSTETLHGLEDNVRDAVESAEGTERESSAVSTAVSPNVNPTTDLHGIEDTLTNDAEDTGEDGENEDVEEEAQTEEEGDAYPNFTERGASPEGRNLQDELADIDGDENEEGEQVEASPRQSVESDKVNWAKLQQTEDEESQDTDNAGNTALLLARLEQENNRLATDAKSVKVRIVEKRQSPMRQPRPPSMAQLRDMAHGPSPAALRYSMLPPPPMTDLEFYMALVKDYQQTAARLPTLLSNKIRKGIPPPLRGVVWQSMSGARDRMLEDAFDRLSGESSPYEGIIGKDLGRSFPGVDMFMDPEGDGQRMLGRVLKCFSLYDTKIGYCQGLAFLVGPLLMHMPDKQAFCVLVKLMEDYDLRLCFVPDLSGLHVRIFQFQELLRQNLPQLSAHLERLQVDPCYVSQWFLSFFAVTCPLPMLFRIYDVIFAEGASETIMRVALSLMRRNEARILACSEMEDIMQLLLSRGLWDCYHYQADVFVEDFVSLSDVVSRERLATLEQGYREERERQISGTKSTDAAGASLVAATASRFLGRLWASSNSPKLATCSPTTSGSTLSPGPSTPSRPLSNAVLRRSASKHSLASTLNSMEAASSATFSSGSSVLSSASTDATSLSRDSAGDSTQPSALGYGAANSKPTTRAASSNTAQDDAKYLNSQIEDLLTALSELQRNHALLADQLQREREERSEDGKAVHRLLDGLRKKAGFGATALSEKKTSIGDSRHQPTPEQLSDLLDAVETRFGDKAGRRRSSVSQTKSQLCHELATAKEQLSTELAKSQDWRRKVSDMEQEVHRTKEQLRESHAHARTLHQDKQKLEKQLHAMRVRASDASSAPAQESATNSWFPGFAASQESGSNSSWLPGFAANTSVPAPNGGLRELKLGRSRSTPSQLGKRTSTLTIQGKGAYGGGRQSILMMSSGPMSSPVSEHDALLLELAQAKTAEAIARQEADEAKQKLESLRKAYGLAPSDNSNATAAGMAASAASTAASAAMGMLGRLTGSAGPSTTEVTPPKPAPAPITAPMSMLGRLTGGGGSPTAESMVPKPAPSPTTIPATPSAATGFWGWRR